MTELPSHQLRLLDAILAGASNVIIGAAPGDLDAVQLYLRSVPFDRMRLLTAMLADQQSRGADTAEAVAARLLLTDYRSAVANLRAATQVVATRIATTSTTVKKSKRVVAREVRRVEKERRR